MRPFERLQAAIIARVFFHPRLCQNAELVANTWMGAWDCFHSFRLSANNQNLVETGLSPLYVSWFLHHAWRQEISVTSNLDRLTLNIEMLETLSSEIQKIIFEVFQNVPNASSNAVSEEHQLFLRLHEEHLPKVVSA